ncbi:MAG: hypothetical protein IJA35_07190 [Clostridia bacterium]|nr:hypothetical protein [Clostridia bacterium]
MAQDWTTEVVARMHAAGITGKQLAIACGITNSYLSAVLHGKKGQGTLTQQKIRNALEKCERERSDK